MGRIVKLEKADYALHNATFIAKLPCSTPSAEEWLTESEVLYKSEKGEFFYYVMTGLHRRRGERIGEGGSRAWREWQYLRKKERRPKPTLAAAASSGATNELNGGVGYRGYTVKRYHNPPRMHPAR